MLRKYFIIVGIIIVAVISCGCIPPESNTKYVNDPFSIHMIDESNHTHRVTFIKIDDKEHLIKCTESECVYLERGTHFEAETGHCVCGHTFSIVEY